MENIRQEVNQIFQHIFNNEQLQVADSMTANDIDGWDSLTHVDLISEIERHFAIKFKLRDITSMKDVGSLIRIVGEKISS